MKGSFFKILIALFILLGTQTNSQNTTWNIEDVDTIEIVEINKFYNVFQGESIFSFLKTTDAYYKLELLTVFSKEFMSSINMRLEEEPFYENSIIFFENFSYLDLSLNYSIGKFIFSFSINNLLSFNDTEFSIEPELFGNNDEVNDFYFIQDQNFSMQTAITYTF